MNKEALHKLAAESLNEGLRLDDWDKIGCVNHDCDQCKAQPSREPLTFEEWLAKQHGDPEEIGFLQALRIAYIAGQDSITKGGAQ